MAKKKIEITGKVVIYTIDGAKVLPAEVRHFFSIHNSTYKFKFDYEGDYLIIGGARTVPTDNIHAAKCRPEIIQQAVNFTKTKFFRCLLDLMRLAQFEPLNNEQFGLFELQTFYGEMPICDNPIDWNVSVKDLDRQFYKKYCFTPAMIDFVERKYSYDD